VDHILPRRLAAHYAAALVGVTADDPENLVLLSGSAHGVKTSRIEPRIFRGDFVGAVQEFRRAGWPLERVAIAFAHYGVDISRLL
jgi:hypothetical protein